LKHLASPEFWACYRALPKDVQELADEKFELLNADPSCSTQCNSVNSVPIFFLSKDRGSAEESSAPIRHAHNPLAGSSSARTDRA